MRWTRFAIVLVAIQTMAWAQTTQEEFFGLEKIWDVHLVVERDDWVRMFPSQSQRATRMFGVYPYRKADVTIGSYTAKGVALRMKGNATFAATAGTLKRSLKIDFDRNDPKNHFLGLTKLNLQCNAVDQTQIKEAVSYQAYRDSGVKACRTCFARVYLTLPGVFERTYVGLYTIVEQVDQRFAKRTHGRGLIVKPDGETLGYLGPEWDIGYEESYHPKSGLEPELTRPLIRAAEVFDELDDEVFARELEAVMDVDQTLRYMAVTTIINTADCPFTVPDNYYLMVPRSTKKVVWVPWDLNWSLGGWSRMLRLPVDDLSIMEPSQKLVFKRLLRIPRFRDRYRAIVADLIDGPCSAATLTASLRRAEAVVKDAIADEADRDKAVTHASKELGGVKRSMGWLERLNDVDVDGLVAFVKARERSVRGQLSGSSKGRPAGRAWGGNRSVRGAPVRTALAGAGAIEVSDKALAKSDVLSGAGGAFARIDSDGSGAVGADEFRAVILSRLKATRPNRMSPQSDREKTATRYAARALRRLDADSSGSVARAEWLAGVESLLPYWDRDRDGSWSRRELDIVRLTSRKDG